MLKTFLFLFLLSLIKIRTYDYESNCECSPSLTFPGANQISIATTPILSPEDEIIDGVNHGKLLAFDNLIWMIKDFLIEKSLSALNHQCPLGYRPPTEQELAALLKASSLSSSNITEFLTNPLTFNFSSLSFYASSTKTYPEDKDGGSNKAWEFKMLKFSKTNNVYDVSVTSKETYWGFKDAKVKCVLSVGAGSEPFKLEGLPDEDLIQGKEYFISIKKQNVKKYFWELNKEKLSSNRSLNITILPSRLGCGTITGYLQIFGDIILSNCKIYWVSSYYGSETDTKLQVTDIKSIDLKVSAVRINNLHFSPGSTPIAPKLDGGVYLLYSDKATNNIIVKILSAEGAVASEIPLNKAGQGFDIAETPWGFTVMIRDFTDTNYLYLAGYYQNGTLKFQRTIMNNGKDPLEKKEDQVTFYTKNDKGNIIPYWGMEAMYNPHNGKIVYARGRINVIFAHYNHFGMKDDGSRNDHTGDAFMSFNDDGKDERIGWGFATSHSLIQKILYDNRKVVVASLGDAYPENIRGARVEPKDVKSDIDPKLNRPAILAYVSSDLVEGKICGSGTGSAAGRIGGLFKKIDKTYGLLYSRSAISASYCLDKKGNDINELAIQFFDSALAKLSKKVLAQNKPINVVNSAQYGKNLFVCYSERAATSGEYLPADISGNTDTSILLVNEDGTIKSDLGKLGKFVLPATDDFETLIDGRVVWSYVDSKNVLWYNYLPAPTSTAPVKTNGKYTCSNNNVLIDILCMPPGSNSIINDINNSSNITNSTSNNTTNGTDSGNYSTLMIFTKIAGIFLFIFSLI